MASNRSEEEVAKLIGADWLVYQDLHDLIAACVHDHSSIKEFDTSCFSGNYVTGDVTPELLVAVTVPTVSPAPTPKLRTAVSPVPVRVNPWPSSVASSKV